MANPSDEQQWKEQWQKAFEEAEVTPSSRVWSGIEGKLAVQEGVKYRRGFLIYRGIAAALLVLIGGLSWYILSRSDQAERPLATESAYFSEPSKSHSSKPDRPATTEALTTTKDTEAPEELPARTRRADQSHSDAMASTGASPSSASSQSDPTSLDRALAGQSPVPEGLSSEAGPMELSRQDRSVSSPSSAEYTASVPAPGGPPRTTDNIATVASYPAAGSSATLPPVGQTLYRVPEPLVDQPEEKSFRPAFFAGLALAPGYFDPQFEAPNSELVMADQRALAAAPGVYNMSSQEDLLPSSGANVEDEQALSFSYGLNVGMRLSDHWVIESGVDYSRFSTTSETRWAIADVTSGERYPYLAANRSALTYDLNANASPALVAATPVDNAYEFIALPLKVGYRRAIDRLQFTLSSGVAANFFLGNNISATGEGFGDYRLSADDQGSPFRSLYYSGIVSGGVNYNVLGSYFLSLTPSYSFALTGLTREGSDISSLPRSFGVNVGIEYQF